MTKHIIYRSRGHMTKHIIYRSRGHMTKHIRFSIVDEEKQFYGCSPVKEALKLF